MNKFNASTIGQDLIASFVVFLVAIPLCLGVALACGVPPEAGLISGIVGGLIAGTFAGCPLQVSGPAAGLITLVWTIVHNYGVEALGPAVLLAGLIQVAFGVFRLGPWFRAVAPAVIEGMLAGIGVLILSSQIHVMFGTTAAENGLENLMMIPETLQQYAVGFASSDHSLAATIGIITIAAMLLWKFAPEKLKVFPPALIGVVSTAIIAFIFQMQIDYVEVPKNFISQIEFIPFSNLDKLLDPGLLGAVFALAVVASAETLLTATAVDSLKKDGEPTNYNKEILSQGLGNTICGLLGALPIAGVIVRSAANVQSGAKTRLSTIAHGLWIVLFVSLAPFILNTIPTATLAAVLVYIGFKLVNVKTIRELKKFGNGQVFIYLITMIGIVAFDLLNGILLGFVASMFKLIINIAHLSIHVDKNDNDIEIDFHGTATFFTMPVLAREMEAIESGKNVTVHLVDLNYIDHACLQYLKSWVKKYRADGGHVNIAWKHAKKRFWKPKTMKKERVAELQWG